MGIKTDLTTIILDKKENNNFVLTAFRDRNNKKELESLNLSQSKTFTSENAETNAKESPVTPLNQESIARRRTDLPSTQSEAEKTTSANANEIIPQEIKQNEIDELLDDYAEQINSNYPQATARLMLEQNKNNGIVLSGFEIKGKQYDPQLEVLEFKSKKAEKEFERLMKSYDTKGDFLKFKTQRVFKPNDEAFLQYLKKHKGDKNAKLALAYNLSKDLINRCGGGRLEVFMTDFLRQIHILENQNLTTLQTNPHLGAGLVGGTLNGLETDEDGNITGFDPAKFAMGFLGGAVGSKAVSMGFKHLEKNPALKEKIITELADTLAQGFDKAKAKYPLLSMLEPRYIIQNERGRKIQAKAMLKELEKQILDDEKINLTKLKAQDLPKADFKNIKEFKDKFTRKSGKYGVIKTPYKAVRVNMAYAYTHFYKNTYNVNRNYIKGAFFDVLQNPLFIAEKETNKGLSTYFYKVYKHKNNQIGIFGIGVNKYGEIEFKTMYEDKKLNRIKEILKLKDENIKYVSE